MKRPAHRRRDFAFVGARRRLRYNNLVQPWARLEECGGRLAHVPLDGRDQVLWVFLHPVDEKGASMTSPAAATGSPALPAAPAQGAKATLKGQHSRSRWNLMQRLRAGWGLARRRPVASAAALLLTTAVLIAVGVHAWALHEYQNAGQAHGRGPPG